MYRSYSRLTAGRHSCTRFMDINSGVGGFWVCPCAPIYFFCNFPKLVTVASKGRGMAELGKSGIGFFGNCYGDKISFERGPGKAMGTVKERSFYGNMDSNWD